MITSTRRLFERWRGVGANATTVPPMDGVLGPNQAIEEAPVLVHADAPDNLVADGKSILFTTRNRIMRLGGPAETAEEIASFDAPVCALAARDGAMAVGLDGGPIRILGGKHDGKVFVEAGGRRILGPTAILFVDADTLLVALGSEQNPPSMWRHDLMQKNASGSIWRVNIASGEATCLAGGLAWVGGLLAAQDGRIIASESWRNRLIALRPSERPSAALADITGYPGRLSAASDGGAWLSVFAPRSQLVEFVLREDDYRRSMMAEIEPRFWIAPSLSPTQSFLEPMQLGGLKQLGILKPWAPTRSFGLIICLDSALEPRLSFHSRADGTRHGITSSLEVESRLLTTSKGGNAIVSIPLEGPGATP